MKHNKHIHFLLTFPLALAIACGDDGGDDDSSGEGTDGGSEGATDGESGDSDATDGSGGESASDGSDATGGDSETGEDTESGGDSETGGDSDGGSIVEACSFGVDEPSGLLITTTDFATGAVSVADAGAVSVTPDVALGTTDAIPYVHGGNAYVVHRFGFDRVDVLDPSDWSLVGEFPVTAPDAASANPHSVAFDDNGLGYVVLNGSPEVVVMDFSQAPDSAEQDRISLADFADDDGNPEASLSIACGGALFVSVQRLDPDFVPADSERLLQIDLESRQVTEGIELNGRFTKQIRRDPGDSEDLTGLVLTSGLERVNFAAGTAEWVISDADFMTAGITSPNLQLQSFDVHGTNAYFAAYVDDYSEVKIWRAALDGSDALTEVAGGYNAVEKTLEIIGDELWFGDTTMGSSGIVVLDLTMDPPEAKAGPLTTGLPPYSLVGLP